MAQRRPNIRYVQTMDRLGGQVVQMALNDYFFYARRRCVGYQQATASGSGQDGICATEMYLGTRLSRGTASAKAR